LPSPRLQPLVRPDDRAAIVALLTSYYPRIFRIAVALCGDPAIAQSITRTILRQSFRAFPRWSAESDAARWFAHHTVLAVRLREVETRSRNDPLLRLTSDPTFIAIITALRALPAQQREAFLLHHGEGFDLRHMATAMDCSSEAAVNHLLAAVDTLRPLAAGQLDEFTTALPKLLSQLLPPADKITLEIQSTTRRHLWPRRLKRWVGWPVTLIAIAWVAWSLWKVWTMISL
jgi:DNA-directed RNA polymerase specialized sigma24 family protein